jgi:hypothetical protein
VGTTRKGFYNLLELAKTVHARRRRRTAVRQDQKAQPVGIAASALVGRMVEPTLVDRQARAMHWTGRLTAVATSVSAALGSADLAAYAFQPRPAKPGQALDRTRQSRSMKSGQAGTGALDQCNGLPRLGQSGYDVANIFPRVL